MVLTLYYIDASPPARSTLLTIKALGIDVNLKEVDLFNGGHLTPEYLKINPHHTVPTLEDGNFRVWDSHAINGYLVDKYGKNDSLYPKDLQKRATVNQRMYFDCGTLFPGITGITRPALHKGVRGISKEQEAAVTQGYAQLEVLLEKSKYVAGNELTIADFSIVSSITSVDAMVPMDTKKYPKIKEWLGRMQALPYYKEANQIGLDKFSQVMQSKL